METPSSFPVLSQPDSTISSYSFSEAILFLKLFGIFRSRSADSSSCSRISAQGAEKSQKASPPLDKVRDARPSKEPDIPNTPRLKPPRLCPPNPAQGERRRPPKLPERKLQWRLQHGANKQTHCKAPSCDPSVEEPKVCRGSSCMCKPAASEQVAPAEPQGPAWPGVRTEPTARTEHVDSECAACRGRTGPTTAASTPSPAGQVPGEDSLGECQSTGI
jgi:hypothetical protein